MRKLLLLPLLALGAYSQIDLSRERDIKLPNGKSQQEEILKADHEKTLKDAQDLVKLAEELQDDLIKSDRHVLSLANLKRVDEIEKLAKRIRSRLRR
jgi:hypothetical protein